MTWFDDQMDADAIVIGAGLAGLAATAELARAGRRVLLLDQESESNMGGQAFWSFGGLFLVGTPEQRRMGIRDSHELAWQDWLGSAFFDRGIDDPAGQDYWAYRWARAYVDFAAGEKRVLAARDGGAVVPAGGLGRTGRLPGRRTRQFGTPFPRHLGHRSCRGGALRAAGQGRGGAPAWSG